MPSPSHPWIKIDPFTPDALDGAAGLLAARHRRHRSAEPLLDPAFEDPSVARAVIAESLEADLASGVVARAGDDVVGYLLGQQKDLSTWGPNVWVESAGHAATEPSIIRELYAAIAGTWVAEGRSNHHVLVPATDTELVDAWFSLDFGQQHVHGVRDVPGPDFGVVPRSELVIRRPTLADLDALVALERVLPNHLAGAPVFSRLSLQPTDEVVAEIKEDLAGSKFAYFVADHEGRVVGLSVACSLELSSGTANLVRPNNAGDLAYAAVLPEARGLGAGRALGEATLVWSREAGYQSIATDWRSANIEADRTWRNMGFRPTFRRLHRLIG
jgi:ribosomal protein S18 acetylase RimI-like enzyme